MPQAARAYVEVRVHVSFSLFPPPSVHIIYLYMTTHLLHVHVCALLRVGVTTHDTIPKPSQATPPWEGHESLFARRGVFFFFFVSFLSFFLHVGAMRGPSCAPARSRRRTSRGGGPASPRGAEDRVNSAINALRTSVAVGMLLLLLLLLLLDDDMIMI